MRYIRMCYPEGKLRALTMSYDDGRTADRRLVEIFNKYGIRGSFHLNSGPFDTGDYITSAEVAELYKNHEVSCHTVTHPFLERSNAVQIINEVWEDRRNLERLCGYPVTGMSYPFGTVDSDVVDRISALGIVYSRTTVSTEKLGLPDNFLLWHPTCHHANPKLNELADRFLASGYPLAVLYVWGHSYEFNNNNNWELIEDFCRKMSGKTDVWYATNIEIVRYVNAVRALVFNADMTMVYNPSAQPVWFTCDGKEVIAEPGKQISF